MIVHGEVGSGDWDADAATPAVMVCGAVFLIDDDGNGVPDGHDFVILPKGRPQVTCDHCRAVLDAPPVSDVVEV